MDIEWLKSNKVGYKVINFSECVILSPYDMAISITKRALLTYRERASLDDDHLEFYTQAQSRKGSNLPPAANFLY